MATTGDLYLATSGDFSMAIRTVMVVVERGSCRAVHLVGQAGIGKTAVADAAGGIASARGWTVAWGRATDGATVPYWPWRQVLAALARGDRRLRLTGPLADLAATAARHPARSRRDRHPSRARAALHAAVVEMLAKAAAQGPV
ncbi:MAG TPA: ATP-binding protein, partial [Mycobacterium sp.]